MKFESYYTPNTHSDLVLRYCGFEECAADFVANPHTRAEYLIHYITQGSGIFTCEETVYPIEKGDIFIIIPHKLVSYQTSPSNPLHFSWFGFAGTKAANIIDQLGFTQTCLVRKLHDQYSIEELIKNYVEILDSVIPSNEFAIQSMLYSILSNLADSYHLTNNNPRDNRNVILEHVGKAKSYIKYNYIHPISVKDVAEHVGLERSYFSKIFRLYTGTTAQRYILNVRLRRSKLLLERTNYTLKEISSYVGMNDEYYFSRAFKLEYQLSPGQYRKQFHEKGPSSIC